MDDLGDPPFQEITIWENSSTKMVVPYPKSWKADPWGPGALSSRKADEVGETHKDRNGEGPGRSCHDHPIEQWLLNLGWLMISLWIILSNVLGI